MDRGAWWATVHRIARVGHDLVAKPTPQHLKTARVYSCTFSVVWSQGTVARRPQIGVNQAEIKMLVGYASHINVMGRTQSLTSVFWLNVSWTPPSDNYKPPCSPCHESLFTGSSWHSVSFQARRKISQFKYLLLPKKAQAPLRGVHTCSGGAQPGLSPFLIHL